MKNLLVLLIILMIFSSSHRLYAQNDKNDPLIIDLSEYDAGSVYSFDKNKTYSYIIIKNTIVGYKYGLSIEKEKEMFPTLKFDVEEKPNTKNNNPCEPLNTKTQAVNNIHSSEYRNANKEFANEKELGKRIKELKKEQEKKECKNDSLLIQAEQAIKRSERAFYQEINISDGEKVIIKIIRIGDNNKDTLQWKFIFKGNKLGKWVTTYGFGFSSTGLEKETYYSKQIQDTSVFEILKSSESEYLDLNYTPAIFFSYFPSQNFDNWLNHSFTAGLGFDLSAPVVFVGYNCMYKHNIGLSAGIVFQQQYKLKTQYSENEIIQTNLDIDQLHDKIYRPNVFISINFRFGENPFTKKETSTNK